MNHQCENIIAKRTQRGSNTCVNKPQRRVVSRLSEPRLQYWHDNTVFDHRWCQTTTKSRCPGCLSWASNGVCQGTRERPEVASNWSPRTSSSSIKWRRWDVDASIWELFSHKTSYWEWQDWPLVIWEPRLIQVRHWRAHNDRWLKKTGVFCHRASNETMSTQRLVDDVPTEKGQSLIASIKCEWLRGIKVFTWWLSTVNFYWWKWCRTMYFRISTWGWQSNVAVYDGEFILRFGDGGSFRSYLLIRQVFSLCSFFIFDKNYGPRLICR